MGMKKSSASLETISKDIFVCLAFKSKYANFGHMGQNKLSAI